MDNVEARAVLASHLGALKARSYAELAELVAVGPVVTEVVGPSGVTYQIEVVAMSDAGGPGDVYIIGSIDVGGWRSLSDGFFVHRPGD